MMCLNTSVKQQLALYNKYINNKGFKFFLCPIFSSTLKKKKKKVLDALYMCFRLYCELLVLNILPHGRKVFPASRKQTVLCSGSGL